jgi:hypothetical protein
LTKEGYERWTAEACATVEGEVQPRADGADALRTAFRLYDAGTRTPCTDDALGAAARLNVREAACIAALVSSCFAGRDVLVVEIAGGMKMAAWGLVFLRALTRAAGDCGVPVLLDDTMLAGRAGGSLISADAAGVRWDLAVAGKAFGGTATPVSFLLLSDASAMKLAELRRCRRVHGCRRVHDPCCDGHFFCVLLLSHTHTHTQTHTHTHTVSRAGGGLVDLGCPLGGLL